MQAIMANAERTAAENLRNQGFEVYLPMALVMNRRTKRPEGRPLFARYLFIRMNLSSDQWRAVFSTRGVSSLICTAGGNPVPAGDEHLDRIRVREVNGMIDLVEVRPDRRFNAGERVRIDDGELEGVFCEVIDKNRVRVLMSFMGRQARTTVSSARLS